MIKLFYFFVCDRRSKKIIELCKKNDLLGIYEMIKKTCYISWKNFCPEKSICYATENLFCLEQLHKIFFEGGIYIIKSDKKIIACGSFEIKKKIACLKIIFVDIDFQRCGFGIKILQSLEGKIKLSGIKKIIVKANLFAVAFYKKNGYEHKNQMLNYCDDCFVMEKNI